jgi:alpha-beta hydrolase superfamily lysophospholipase
MVSFLDRDVVVQRLFRPRKEENGPLTSAQPVAFVVATGIKVWGYLHPLSATSSLVLLFHGNGELAVEYQRLTPLFAQSGLSLLVMDYRGYGASDGAPSTTHLLLDAVTILDAVPQLLAEQQLRPRNIFVMGRSLGSAAACELAFRRGTEMDGLIIR